MAGLALRWIGVALLILLVIVAIAETSGGLSLTSKQVVW